MKIGLVVIALIVLLSGAIYSRIKLSAKRNVLSVETDQISTPTVTSNPNLTPTFSPSLTPTKIPTKTPTPTSKSLVNTSLSSFVYPNSVVLESSSNSLELTSQDDPDKITNWYKDKIKATGISVTSFVTTKTNNNVLNKLVGADGKLEVRVEIEKNANEERAHIFVDLTIR